MRKSLLILIICLAGISISRAQTESKIKNLPVMQKEQIVKKSDPVRLNASYGQDLKVIKSFTKGDKTIQLLKTPDGAFTKRVLGEENKVPSRSQHPVGLKSADDEYRLYESFEDAPDDADPTWLPEGWASESKVGNVYTPEEVCFTWTHSSATFLGASPSDGNYMMYIGMNLDVSENEELITFPQDEWLYSPEFIPVEGDYLFFDAYYAPTWLFLNLLTYDLNLEDPQMDFEALISTDDGKTWETIWYAGIEGGYDEDNVWDYMEGSWRTIKYSLEDYIGKKVQIAFHFTGETTDNSALDRVYVSEPKPEASYAIPQGFFYGGLNPEGNGGEALMFGPAYKQITWRNASENATAFNWELPVVYPIENEGDSYFYSSTEENPSETYINDAYYFPYLTVMYGDKESSQYQWAIDGGLFPSPIFFAGGNFEEMLFQSIRAETAEQIKGVGVGNFDIRNGITTIQFDDGGYLFGTSTTTNSKAVGNYFEQPLQPYLLRGIAINTYKLTCPANTELELTIYKSGPNGLRGDVLTTSKWIAKQDIDGGDFTIQFDQFEFKEDDGLIITEDEIVIEDAIFIELKGWEGKENISFGVYCETMKNDGSRKNNAYVYANNILGEPAWLEAKDITPDGGATSLCFNLDLVYSFIGVYDMDYTFDVPAEGGEKSFELETYFSSEEWEERNLPDWLTETVFDLSEFDMGVFYTLEATALPDGEDGRSASIKLSDGKGGACSILVLQGNKVGINSVKKNNVKVYRSGDLFLANYDSDLFNTVSIYSVSGRKEATYQLSGDGKQVISGTSLTRGVYILKFSGKSTETVKIVK